MNVTSTEQNHCFLSKYSIRIPTARLCASNPSTAASCITAPDKFRKPSAVRWEVVMCLTKEPRLTPEYCFA